MYRNRYEKLENVPLSAIGKCKFCAKQIAWMESKKTPGKKYCVNIIEDDPNGEEVIVNRYGFHNCRDRSP